MKRLLFSLPMLGLLMAASGVQAGATIDFDIPTSGQALASVSYAGGSSRCRRSNISVSTVTGLDTPSNNLVSLLITNGLLNFTTGDFVKFQRRYLELLARAELLPSPEPLVRRGAWGRVAGR